MAPDEGNADGPMEDPGWGSMIPDEPTQAYTPPQYQQPPPGPAPTQAMPTAPYGTPPGGPPYGTPPGGPPYGTPPGPARPGRPGWIVPTAIGVVVVIIAAVVVLLVTHKSKKSNSNISVATTTATTTAPASTAATTTPTTVATTTTAAPTPTTVAAAPPTQAQLMAALITQAQAGTNAKPTTVQLCGGYTHPTTYAATGYEVTNGSTRNIIISLAGYYPSAATASAQFAPIEATSPACAGGSSAPAFTTIAAPQLCDQSFEGKSPLTISGAKVEFYFGLVRCGANLGAVEVLTTNQNGKDSDFEEVMSGFGANMQSLP